jgi:hypothetical protein
VNKKTYYLIGDCHSNQILKRYIEDLSVDIDFKVFASGGWPMRAFGTTKIKDDFISDKNGTLRKVYKDGVYRGKEWVEIDPLKFSEIKDSEDSVIIFFLGYIDIKNILPLKNDSYESIERFFLEIKKFFPKSLIKIIEPMPQFKISLYRDEENWTEYSYGQRREQNDLFLKNLRSIAKNSGIEIVLTQEEIMKSFNVGIDDIAEESSFHMNYKPTDNFSVKIYKGVWDSLKISLHIS